MKLLLHKFLGYRDLQSHEICEEFYIKSMHELINHQLESDDMETMGEDVILFKSMSPNYQYVSAVDAVIQVKQTEERNEERRKRNLEDHYVKNIYVS